jgi:hypothetical protein
MDPILYKLDPIVCDMFITREEVTCAGSTDIRKQLLKGYFTPHRARIFILLSVLDREDSIEQRRELECGRAVLHYLLDTYEVDIHCFIRDPFSYGARLPYYWNVVTEVMYLEKIIWRLEIEKIGTFMQDLYIMFQNFVDYSTLVNPTHHGLRAKVFLMYEECVGLYKTWCPSFVPIHDRLLVDGKTERHRKHGISFEEECIRMDRMRQRMLRQFEHTTLQQLRARWIVPSSSTLRPSEEEHGEDDKKIALEMEYSARERRELYRVRVGRVLSKLEERMNECLI